MTTPNAVLKLAAGEIGYYAPDDPLPGSKYGRWMAEYTGESWLAGSSREIWWCCIFVSWCYINAGGAMPGMPNYNCDNLKSKARSYVLSNKRDAQPGDFVLFDWGGDGSCDHIGIIEKNYGSYIQTIEGNTSGSNGGSQSAGNGVWRRTRSWSVVNCVIRPNYTGDEDMPLTNEDIAAIWAYGGAGPMLTSSYNTLNTIQNKVAPAMPVAAADVFIYRLEKDGVHHWTSNQIEVDDLVGAGWKNEGEAFQAPVVILIHRLTTDRDEFLTVYIDEVYEAIKAGYSYNGIAGVAAAFATDYHEGLTPVHRLLKDGLHMMSAKEGEIAALTADGWTDEGVAFYVAAE